MGKWLSSVGLVFIWAIGSWSCTTPSKPVVHYTITNHTNQHITSITQLESTDSSFTNTDSTLIRSTGGNQYIGVPGNKDWFKPCIKLLIQTNTRQYSSSVLLYPDRCTAYVVNLTNVGLSVEKSNFYRIRRQVINWYIVFLVTFFIRGGALLLLASQYARNLLLPFTVLNTALVVLFKITSEQPIIAPEWRFFCYASIPLSEFVIYYGVNPEGRRSSRLLLGIALGSGLWIFPGYLLILFGRFIFAGC